MNGPGRSAIIDISPPLTNGIGVFPGDTPLTRELLLDFARGDSLTLSTLRATVHLGAHVDAPLHYGAGTASIDEMPLELFVGPCRVLPVPARADGLIGWDEIRAALGGESPTERLLLATGSYPDPNRFDPGFAALDPAAVGRLAERGVRLLGLDTPSVDPADSRELPAHAACLESGIAILEGLVLAGVAAGTYELMALPLRLVGFEASPVRAVLRSLAGAS